jgi:hypothetical protein
LTETKPTHPEMVAGLAKSGQEILDSLDPEHWSALKHCIERALSEGNHLDTVKKKVIYNSKAVEVISDEQTIPDMNAADMHNLHMAVGIVGEAAEILEEVFSSISLGHPLDIPALTKEMGDEEFYMEGLRQGIGVSRETVLEGNITKLEARYKGLVYSDTAAINQADKA